jgi:hypothetical protein
MRKLLPVLVFSIYIFGGLGTIAIPSYNSETIRIVKSLTFLEQPKVEVKDDFLKIEFDGATTKLMAPGEPELPIYIETFMLPKEAKNIKVIFTIKDIEIMKIPGQIIPAFVYPLGLQTDVDKSLEKNEQLYMSNNLYPKNWFSYDIGRGLDGIDQVTFVKIVCNVVRYAPNLNIIKYLKGVDIAIKYNDPGITISEPDVYDMVIITPQRFANAFQPLVNHKNSYGLNTTLKTVEDILIEYEGFDAPEKIKYFIKYAIEEWGISYVLLGGGLKSHFYANDREDLNYGTKGWHVPVRYTNIIEWAGILGELNIGCISDLYYADIYESDGNFSSWDSNGDGFYAAWGKEDVENDILDLYPDVYVARLPCRNKLEVKICVKKIINYESKNPSSRPWYKKMIGIAGCTNEIYHGQLDGEYVCNLSFDYMNDFVEEEVKVYASNRDIGGLTPISKDIIKAFNGGAGFVFFEGHGNPFSWDTHWDNCKDWIGGIDISNFWRLFNLDKLPVVVVGGCHNGLFSVSMLKTFIVEFFYLYYHTFCVPTPICFSWGLCLVPWGGAIASTGLTGYGFIAHGQPVSLSCELDVNFFYEVGKENMSNFAQAHGGSITKYLNEHKIIKKTAYCITVYHAFGDPSLKFGGYK